MRVHILLVFGMLAALGLTACGGGPQVEPTEEPRSIEDFSSSLREAGARVQIGEEVNQPFIEIAGILLRVNDQDVQVFEYSSEEEADRLASQVSADGSSVGTTMVMWVEPPHYFQDGRLIVLYVGEDEGVLNLLVEVLGPQFAGR